MRPKQKGKNPGQGQCGEERPSIGEVSQRAVVILGASSPSGWEDLLENHWPLLISQLSLTKFF